ncbi:phage tail length tape measure family protein [Hyphomicrobium denitrificans]|uniref:phage tail length tape measure family protein n=1 Tax=Hyphomicrobium denitrificans TaxID=53399 RepID=UPI00022E52AD|nr:phage tail length tape measure family protein [Hyphomicrobium denitrificans]
MLGVGPSGAGSARDSARVFEDAARASEDLARRTQALRAQIDPLGAAQAKLNTEIAEANALVKAGAISAGEQAAAHQLAPTRFDATAKALKGVGDGARLANYQILNLGYQINDVVVGLASGQRPLTILAQQGTQIAQIFAGSGLGVGGVLKELGRVVAGLISPTVALVAGLAAVGGTALYAYNSTITAQKELQVATAGIGRAAGATVDQLNRIADSAVTAGRVSVAAARDMEVAFLRSGRIGIDQFGDLIVAAKNYAAATGQDLETATKELTEAFADPGKGVDLLNAKVGGYDDRTRLLIKTLAAQNDLTGAQKRLFDGLAPSLIDAAETTTALGRAWDFVARTASNAVDALGRAIDEATDPTLHQQLEDLRSR